MVSRRRGLPLFCLLGVVLLASPTAAVDLQVPGQYPTIQQAVEAAGAGDVVLVAPGTYPETLDFLGRAILVQSTDGPEVTIIDGQGLGSVVVFTNDEGPGSILQGFTITGGSCYPGCGANTGGGIRCSGTSPTIVGNIIAENEAFVGGGGISAELGSPTIIDNTIRDNSSDYEGGGIHLVTSNAHVERNVITGNVASLLSGGGIYCCGSSPLIVGNLLYGNTSLEGGGLICEAASMAVVLNNTIVANAADLNAGGVSCRTGSHATIANCIVWGNMAGSFDDDITVVSSSPIISFSDIAGGWPGPGNIDEDPIFADPFGDDYHLDEDSPCIDGGTFAIPGTPGLDLDGDTRPLCGVMDLGADEAPAPVGGCLLSAFVRGDVDGDGDFAGLVDGLHLLNYQFVPGAPGLPCEAAADVDDSGSVGGLVDGVAILTYQFVPGSPPPAPPFPACGVDPTVDLSCADSPCP